MAGTCFRRRAVSGRLTAFAPGLRPDEADEMAFDITRREKLAALAFLELPLTELHLHVGASVAPHVMWSIAHQQGLRLPVRSYWEFFDLITVSEDKVHSVEDYLAILHRWTEKIQSSPAAMERCTYEIISKEYRGANVTAIELRFNPMKRNLGGERDLDHIIHAAIRGMDQAVLEYGCKAGLIFCLAREFSFELNRIIVDKAIRYRERGVVGIDLAGPEHDPLEHDDVALERYAALFARAARSRPAPDPAHRRDAGDGSGRDGAGGAQAEAGSDRAWRPGGALAGGDEGVARGGRGAGGLPVVQPLVPDAGWHRAPAPDPGALCRTRRAVHDLYRWDVSIADRPHERVSPAARARRPHAGADERLCAHRARGVVFALRAAPARSARWDDMLIESTRNQYVKKAAALRSPHNRKKIGRVLIEGRKAAKDALRAGAQVEYALVRAGFGATGSAASDVLEVLKEYRVRIHPVTPPVFDKISATETSQGIVLVAREPAWDADEVLDAPGNRPLVVLEALQDPRNLGATLRSAAALGFRGALLTKGSTDPFAAKVVRTAAATVFSFPVLQADAEGPEVLAQLRERGYQLLAAAPGGEPPEVALRGIEGPVALLIGSEGHGLAAASLEQVERRVWIPIEPRVESLNAAVAFGILAYVLSRQLRK
ncbi:MAG: hypothetical protein KatS3mg102_2782 [Planctomycetota bacterium]|nr:MAG: hypothetical protein KatS3mg102_2782 [Planctomycetota bacterium]